MTALTLAAARCMPARPAAGSGVTRQRAHLASRSTPACPGWPSARSPPTPVGRLGLGRHRVRPTTPRRTSTASASTELAGLRTWHRVGGAELNGSGVHRIVWIGETTSTPRPATACTGGPCTPRAARTGGRSCSRPGRSSTRRAPSVTDVIAVPGSRWPQDPRRGRLGGLQQSAGRREQRLLRRQRRAGQLHQDHADRRHQPGHHRPDDLQLLRRLALRGGPGHHAPATCAARAPSSPRSGNPAGPWTRIADVDKLAGSDSALGDSTSNYYPGVQADYNQYILADPKDRQHVYLQLEEVFESTDGGRHLDDRRARTGTTTSPASEATATRTPARRRPTPTSTPGMIYRGQFWAGNDGGVWRRPLDAAPPRPLDRTSTPQLHTLQNYSSPPARSGPRLAYWGGLQDNGESYTRTEPAPGRAGVHRRRRRHHRRPERRRPGGRGVRLPRHVPDHRRRGDDPHARSRRPA